MIGAEILDAADRAGERIHAIEAIGRDGFEHGKWT
jgi:hypothetical protein